MLVVLVAEEGSGSAVLSQSYDLTCIDPRSSLLNTVIPGWLWSGITAFRGRKRMTICQRDKGHRRGRLDKNTSFTHTHIEILPTEKFGHLYIVVCVMVGVPPPRVASRALKKLRSGLRPTSSGRILSAFW